METRIPVVNHVILLPVLFDDGGGKSVSARSAKERSMMDFITPVNTSIVYYTNHLGKMAADGISSATPLHPLAAVENQNLQPALRPEEVLVNQMTGTGNGAIVNSIA